MAYGVFVHTVLPRDLIYRCVLVYTRAAGALCLLYIRQEERVYRQTSTLRAKRQQVAERKKGRKRATSVKSQKSKDKKTEMSLLELAYGSEIRAHVWRTPACLEKHHYTLATENAAACIACNRVLRRGVFPAIIEVGPSVLLVQGLPFCIKPLPFAVLVVPHQRELELIGISKLLLHIRCAEG